MSASQDTPGTGAAPRGPGHHETSNRLGKVLVFLAVAFTLSLGLMGVATLLFLVLASQGAPESLDLSVAVLAVLWSLAGTLLIWSRRLRWRLTGAGILIVALAGSGLIGRYLVDTLGHVMATGDAGEVAKVCGPFELYRIDREALAAVHRRFPGVPAEVAVGCNDDAVEVRVGPFVGPGKATRLVVQEDVGVRRHQVTVAPYAHPWQVTALFPEIVQQTPSLGAGPRRCLLQGTDCVGLGCENVPPYEIWCVKPGAHRAPASCIENQTGCGYVPVDLPGY